MVQIVRRVQDIRIKSVVTMASAKELAREKEMVVASAIKDISETLVQSALQDTMNLIKMKRLCYVPHATQRAMDLAEGLDQRIAKSVPMDGT